MSWIGELRGLVADKLVWWAFRLDPERFLLPRKGSTMRKVERDDRA